MHQTELYTSQCPWILESPVGKGEAIEAILAALEVVSEPFRSFANTLVDVCAYAGLCPSPQKLHFPDPFSSQLVAPLSFFLLSTCLRLPVFAEYAFSCCFLIFISSLTAPLKALGMC